MHSLKQARGAEVISLKDPLFLLSAGREMLQFLVENVQSA